MDTPSPAGLSSTPQAEDLSGKVLGDFRVAHLLGEGGMGQVYLAEQLSLKRRVALKVMRRALADNPVSVRRFRAEAEAIAQFTHPNIVQVHFVGEHEGLPYLALEYVEGNSLEEYLARKGPLSAAVALVVMRHVAAALREADERGIVHRDIKPANLLVTPRGQVKVTDFGLSRSLAGDVRLTTTGVVMGTPLYMSPEQVQGRHTDIRSDIYSFGATCYHLLAGRPPFEGATPLAVALQHVEGDCIPLGQFRPDLPEEMVAVVHTMMARKPEDRYPNGQALLRVVNQLRVPVQAVKATRPTHIVPLAVREKPEENSTDWPIDPSDTTENLHVSSVRSKVVLVAAVLAGLLVIVSYFNASLIVVEPVESRRMDHPPSPVPVPSPVPSPDGFAHVPRVLLVYSRPIAMPALFEALRDAFENARAQIVLASAAPFPQIPDQLARQRPIAVTSFDIQEKDYDAICFFDRSPEGPELGPRTFRSGAKPIAFALLTANKPVVGVGDGIEALAELGLLKGRRVACTPNGALPRKSFGVTEEVDKPVVVDGPVITARDADAVKEMARVVLSKVRRR